MTNHFDETEQTGLCSTCIHNANCTSRLSFKGKILQCEEFDDTITDQKASIEQRIKNNRILEVTNDAIKAAVEQNVKNPVTLYYPLKGLCMNCAFAPTCALPKSETGVWHCNEYK